MLGLEQSEVFRIRSEWFGIDFANYVCSGKILISSWPYLPPSLFDTSLQLNMTLEGHFSIPSRLGKYIPVQTNCGITDQDKQLNSQEEIGFYFIENHYSKPLELKRGQTIGLVTSCVVTQYEQGQKPEKREEDTQCVTGWSNDM